MGPAVLAHPRDLCLWGRHSADSCPWSSSHYPKPRVWLENRSFLNGNAHMWLCCSPYPTSMGISYLILPGTSHGFGWKISCSSVVPQKQCAEAASAIFGTRSSFEPRFESRRMPVVHIYEEAPEGNCSSFEPQVRMGARRRFSRHVARRLSRHRPGALPGSTPLWGQPSSPAPEIAKHIVPEGFP